MEGVFELRMDLTQVRANRQAVIPAVIKVFLDAVYMAVFILAAVFGACRFMVTQLVAGLVTQFVTGRHCLVSRLFSVFAIVLGMGVGFGSVSPVLALEPIVLTADVDRIEITKFSEHYKERGDTLQVETAADGGGISNRMAVKAQTPGTDPKWIVFALKNPTDKQIVRWVTTDRYNIVGSRVIRPDLDARRINHVTPSVGFLPLRVPNDAVDIFSITLEPGATVTFVAELSNTRFPRVILWEPLAFSKKLRDMTLFNGIMLGIVGILAIFLTAIFVANHKSIFPATAFIAWCVGAYLCVDFGFWHKLFRLDPSLNSIYRAATEAAIAASLVVFLYTFLRLRFWHGWIKMLFGVWTFGQLGLVGLAILDPVLVSGFARLSLLFLGSMGSLLIGYLAIRGQDRALALVPTWLLFLVWLFGAGVAAMGHLSGDIVAPALTSGLVLILVLFGFTVTQFAFRSFEPLAGAPPSQLQLRSLALEGAGAAVWQWSSRRDEISVSPEIEDSLGLHEGELTCRVEQWMQYLHPSDREKFRLLMRTLQEKNGGELLLEFRMRGHEGHFLWYELRAHSVMMPHQRSLRCVGLMRDITSTKHSQERLLNDAVHDSLTGLPNRELFLDRLNIAITRVKDEGNVSPPTVLFVDIDRFKHVNQSFGMVIGDTMLLTIARRLQRHLGPQDSLARLSGDQFAVLLVTENNPQEIALLAERIRRSLRSPMKIGGKEIILTGSIGIAVYDGTQLSHQELVNEAELAMYRAKRSGTDRIEIFKPTMRDERDNRIALESDLRRAIERRQIKILYQPVTKLKGEDLSGFEALIRWDHPKHGRLSPAEFIPIAEESDLISELGAYVLNQAVKDAVQWNRILSRPNQPLVVSVNISSRELFRQELYQEVRMILAREQLPENSLRLEVTESLVMENPEVAVEILGWLRNAGASLALDDFGTGYSSLSYLHRFPFDTLKVDRSIVQNVAFGKTGPAILRSVVALANELDMDVVAEGVETEDDVSFLRSIGCGFAQGFYFGEAMNQKDVIYLLEALSNNVKNKDGTGLFGIIRAKTGASDVPAVVGNGDVPGVVSEQPVHSPVGFEGPGQKGISPALQRDQVHKPVQQDGVTPPAPLHHHEQHRHVGAHEAAAALGADGATQDLRQQTGEANGHIGADFSQLGEDIPGHFNAAGLRNEQGAKSLTRALAEVDKSGENVDVSHFTETDKKLQGLSEALSMAEKSAVAGRSVGASQADMNSTVDDRISGMKTSIPGADIYQQLASGNGYSDVNSIDRASDVKQASERNFQMNSNGLKGAPQGEGVTVQQAHNPQFNNGQHPLPPVDHGRGPNGVDHNEHGHAQEPQMITDAALAQGGKAAAGKGGAPKRAKTGKGLPRAGQGKRAGRKPQNPGPKP